MSSITYDVIIPIYKVKPKWITECLDSVIAQKIQDWRVIIVDGTPAEDELADGITNVCLHYVNSDPRFVYLKQGSDIEGVGGARNQGIAYGDAPWVAFLDADDYWYPDHLAFIQEVLDAKDTPTRSDDELSDPLIIYTAADTHIPMESLKGGEITSWETTIGYYPEAWRIHPAHTYFRLMGMPPITSQVVVRRDRLEAIGGFDDRLAIVEDTDCWMRVIIQHGDYMDSLTPFSPLGVVVQCDAVGGYHRLHEDNTTNAGPQTAAKYAEGGIWAKFKEAGDICMARHPRPSEEFIIEHSNMELKEGYADWLVAVTGGVNRPQVLTGLDDLDSDISKPWFAPH